jgi:hypothetical protein
MYDTKANGRTETNRDEPNTHQLAAELGVDARLLDRFVSDHPNPTAPIVIGWAHARGELRCHPEQLTEDVEAWIDARPTPTHEPLEVPDDGRLRWNRDDDIAGGAD